MRLMILAGLGLATAAGMAAAQEWRANPEGSAVTTATARWESGAILFSRCEQGQLAVMIPLAVAVQGDTARVSYSFDQSAPVGETWSVSADGRTAFARNPGRFARALMNGSSLALTIAGEDAPSQRFELDLDRQAEPLARTLTACGQSLEDSRDALPLIDDPHWIQRPSTALIRNLYPLEAAAAGRSGIAHVACVARWDGVLEDCSLLSETPRGLGFGEATLGAARHHRLEPATPAGANARARRGLVHLSMRWQLG